MPPLDTVPDEFPRIVFRAPARDSGDRTYNELFKAWSEKQAQAIALMDESVGANGGAPWKLLDEAEQLIAEARVLRQAALAKFNEDLVRRGLKKTPPAAGNAQP